MVSPAVTCLVMSHMKIYLDEALRSLQNQDRRRDIDVVIMDSGAWLGKTDAVSVRMREIYDGFKDEPTFTWYFTGESGPSSSFCPVSHWTNEAIRNGLIRGRYFCTFYDDDRYYPDFMRKMAGYLDAHPGHDAVWCSENISKLMPSGERVVIGQRPAHVDKSGQTFDCVVDGMQVMIRSKLLGQLLPPAMDERPEHCFHSDGLFLNRVAALGVTFFHIPEALCEHVHTPASTYTPADRV